MRQLGQRVHQLNPRSPLRRDLGLRPLPLAVSSCHSVYLFLQLEPVELRERSARW